MWRRGGGVEVKTWNILGFFAVFSLLVSFAFEEQVILKVDIHSLTTDLQGGSRGQT